MVGVLNTIVDGNDITILQLVYMIEREPEVATLRDVITHTLPRDYAYPIMEKCVALCQK